MRPMEMRLLQFIVLLFLASNLTCFGETYTWTLDSPNCRKFLVDGATVRAMKHRDVHVYATLEDLGGYLRATLAFLNAGKEPLDVIPERFSIVVLEPKQKTLKSENPDKAIASVAGGSRWAGLGAAMAAGAAAGASTPTQTSQSTTQGRVELRDSWGNTTQGIYQGRTTTTTQDENAPFRAGSQAGAATTERSRQLYQLRAQKLANDVLLANTVTPKESLSGDVYFKGGKKATAIILRLPIGDNVFEFPFGR